MKLKENLAMKITAVILSYVMITVLILSALAIGIMGYYKFYFSSVEVLKEEILTDMAEGEASYINILLYNEKNLERYYRDKNVFYRITYNETGEVLTNYNNEPYLVTATDVYEYYGEEYLINDKFGNEVWTSDLIKAAEIEVFIAKDMRKNDMFSVTAKIIQLGYSLRYAIIFIAIGALISEIVLLCYLYCAAGHKAGGKIISNPFDKIPFDLITAAVIFLAILSIVIVSDISYGSRYYEIAFVVFLVASVDYFIALSYTLTFATRIKTGTFLKYNILYYILKFVGKKFKALFDWIKFLFNNLSLVKKTLIFIGLAIPAEIIAFIILYASYWSVGLALVFITAVLLNILVVSGLLYFAITLQKIKIGGERIAGGDLNYKIDTQYIYGDFKDFSESLNNINKGLQAAVNEKMKSEHFKTELITNVSHDIKTPLTSIINYVDLIKKENTENENIKNYISVLDRQSNRLKKLVEDLVEASKASSGVLNVNLSACDVTVLLTQALGEYEDKLKAKGITAVISSSEKPLYISADGRHLWRVFDNLLINICKYSLAGTRAYFDIKEIGDSVSVTFRNISEFELNISPDELMERFVRGDKSRNSEGSGLGLSIARSLTELQGGKLDIFVDGDLFKVNLTFKKIRE